MHRVVTRLACAATRQTRHQAHQIVELPSGSTSWETLPITGLGEVEGIAVDAAGDVFVANTEGSSTATEWVVFELPAVLG